jgi:hypothetical protein
MARDTGAKKMKFQELIQKALKFEPATEPIVDGAAAVDRALGVDGRGLKRAVLDVLLTAVIYDEYDAMTANEIFI